MGAYDDIINLSRPKSNHPKMSIEQRSAQFAPFAALTSFGDKVKETARLTDRKIELDEEMKNILDMKIQDIKNNLSNNKNNFTTQITYFISDNKKEGGKYVTITDAIYKIDEYKHQFIMKNGLKIDISEILDINIKLQN